MAVDLMPEYCNMLSMVGDCLIITFGPVPAGSNLCRYETSVFCRREGGVPTHVSTEHYADVGAARQGHLVICNRIEKE